MENPQDKLRYLQKFGASGYTWFSIRAVDTKENNEILAEFKNLALKEFDDNYFQALKALMDYRKADAKITLIAEDVIRLSDRVSALELKEAHAIEKKEEPQEDEDEDKVF